jgi:adenylate kinase
MAQAAAPLQGAFQKLCLILFGPPGSGKGTQAKFLSQSLGLAHISTGDMLRAHLQARDELGKEIESVMQSGGLVPDETVNRMVENRIAQPDCEKGFILDGFPRTVNQARLLHGLLEAKRIGPVVVHLDVDYNVIISRIAGRRQCPTCGALYSVRSNAPTVSEVCDYDGSKLAIRDDDRPEVVRERLRAYKVQTAPVLECLKQFHYSVVEVEGAGAPPQAIAAEIEKKVREIANDRA